MAAKPPSGEFFRLLAQTSWVLVIVAIAEQACVRTFGGAFDPGTIAWPGRQAFILTAVTGVVFAVIGLWGIRKHGRAGILVSSFVGIGLWSGIFVLIAGVAVFNAFARFHDFEPLRHVAGGAPMNDQALGCSFDVPPDYRPFAGSAMPAGCRYAWFKPVDFEPNRMIEVKVLDGPLPRRHLRPADLPPGDRYSLTTFSWRGLPVDAIVIHGKLGDRDYLTINVQVPLAERGIQIGFGGPVASADELRGVAEQVLGSLSGETNWRKAP